MSTVPRQRSGVRRRPLSKAEYYALGEAGFFRGEKVELIEGQLVVQSPQESPHYTHIRRVARVLEAVFGPGHDVRQQGPLDLGQITEPEPDVAVVAGTFEDYLDHHPTTALLIVEVSVSTLAYDRGRKASLYARAGVADYWIVNVPDLQLEVHRDPAPDATAAFGHSYSLRQTLRAGAAVSPLARPTAAVAVSDLLGPPVTPSPPP
ncbi:MAG: Uma2 family endonuclease [Gemmataceae bacterium]